MREMQRHNKGGKQLASISSLEKQNSFCASAWGSPAFIASSGAPTGRASEFKASSCAGLWDGANLLSCFSALMCKLIIRHCALIKLKWCNGFAVIEARALPGLGEGGAVSVGRKQPCPRSAESEEMPDRNLKGAGNAVLGPGGWRKM